MTIYDISLTITESIPVWEGDKKPIIRKLLTLEEGGVADVTYLKLCAHTGTHVDAPCHFIKDGKGVETLPLEILCGKALVIEEMEEDLLTKEVLEKHSIPPDTRRILFKTKNGEQWIKEATEFKSDFVALSPDGAHYLVEKGIKLVGIDYLGIARPDALTPVHFALLSQDVIILEAIDLTKVAPGVYTLHCLPLKILSADGAPARAILTK